MLYWPISVVRTSPLLPGDCAAELDALPAKLTLSIRACEACIYVIERTPPVKQDDLIAMEGDEKTIPKLVYAKQPTAEQWVRLERIAMIQGPDCFLFICEQLH